MSDKKVVICFDVDGTLRCNCTPECQDPNKRIVELAEILYTFKNTKLIVWSGSGKEYAETQVRLLKLGGIFSAARCYSKLEYLRQKGKPDVAIDDVQDTDIGKINLIVHEK